MASFEDFGLRGSLTDMLDEGDFEHPTALQEAIVPALRREGNVVARAGSGSGKTVAYALGILDRIEPSTEDAEPTGVRVLILAPTHEAAERAADELAPWTQAAGLMLALPGGGWGADIAAADLVIATPTEAMSAVRASGLKLENLQALVVDGASDMEHLGEWEALDTLFDHAPRTAQRVILTAESTPAVDDLVERRVKRPLRYPAQPAVPGDAPKQASRGVLGYVVVQERERLDTLARLLGDGTPPAVLCRTDERAAQLAEQLAGRGFSVGDADDEEVDVAVPSASTSREEIAEGTTVISYDVPVDERTLVEHHGSAGSGFVFVQPREVAHLREIAARAGYDLSPAGVTGEQPATAGALAAFRDQLRRAVAEEDIGAQMLVLEPLFDEFTPAEVAAACAALLRKRAPLAASAQASAATPAAASSSAHAPSDLGPAPSPIVRLFVGVGERDGVRAGDLVGAIAGETNIPGSQIGRIEIRDSFSVVEVPASLAERVIRAVNGTTIKGRSVRVDFDRGADRAKRAPGMRRPTGGAPARDGSGPPRTLRRPRRDDDRPPRHSPAE